MTLKLGYLVPTRENVMRGEHGTGPLLDQARLAVDLGFDSLWVGDSLTARPRHDPLTLLAALATSTSAVELGTAVLLPALRNPVVLAQQIATVDQLAEGRLIVGAGIAADNPMIRAEFESAGVPFEKRVGRFLEAFRVMRALWTGEPVSWQGRWTLNDQSVAPLPFREGGPPIWIGTGSDAGLERTAKHFDGWFPLGPDLETFSQRREKLLSHRGDEAITTALYATIALMDDEEAAERAIDDYMLAYYHVPASVMRSVQTCCAGPLTKILDFLRAYRDSGAEHIVLRVVGDHLATLRALGRARDELG